MTRSWYTTPSKVKIQDLTTLSHVPLTVLRKTGVCNCPGYQDGGNFRSDSHVK